MTDDSRLHAELDAAGIRFDQVEHEAVFTVLESSALERSVPGAHTKNLFLKDTSGQFYLVTVLAENRSISARCGTWWAQGGSASARAMRWSSCWASRRDR